MIRAVIFDLDNCLAAANGVERERLFEPAFEAMRNANHGRLSEAALEEALGECWRRPLDDVARKYGFSREMLAAGWRILAETIVETPMKGSEDTAFLRELPAQLYLVTSGFRRLQESKIRALGFSLVFAGIHVDAIDEANKRKGKRVFCRIHIAHEQA